MTKTILFALSIAVAAPSVSAQTFSVPAPVVSAPLAPAPPAPPQIDLLDLSQIDLPDLLDLDIQIPDVSIQVDEALKGAQKALEKLPKVMASLQVPAPPAPPARPAPFGKFGNDENAYDQARNEIERDQYDRALQALDRVIEGKGTRVEAAMYWKAYSLSKLSRRPEALTVLADLQKQFPNGQWVRDARALEVELKQASGQSVSADNVDDDIKLLALRGLMQSQSEQAVPQVERLLQGNSSVRVKQRALILLGQSNNPRARTVLANVAKSGSNPDLRLSAISYLGMHNDAESLQFLEETYRATNDRDVKQAILRSFMQSPNAIDKLAAVARTEKDEDLQKMAIRNMGATGRGEGAEALKAIYSNDASMEVKKEVINALSMSPRNAATLVSLAKAEKNSDLKKAIVTRLSTMHAPEAQQYLLEILQ